MEQASWSAASFLCLLGHNLCLHLDVGLLNLLDWQVDAAAALARADEVVYLVPREAVGKEVLGLVDDIIAHHFIAREEQGLSNLSI